MSRDQALEHWFAPDRSVFVAEEGGLVLGTYYLRANRPGPGAHVSNAGFMVSDKAGGRGVGQALCEHALATAKARGFAAMQFNFVVAANERAVRLWQRVGFAEIGRAPDAFQHPRLGLVDALVMHRKI
jgi:ribosomal protein S18 acetylase RimI-like enzyme